ncbi:MAG: adenylosuccinate synthetase [Caldimonas sp.]
MAADRLVSVIGLGFGDCGKGLATDFLVRRLGAHTVVRFNGGAQAGHNVVLPDGRRHTFSQFGSGSFTRGVVTVLAQSVVVHPTALLEEARVLAATGVDDALERLHIDGRCRITTPFHQAAGRLREWQRGAGAHGSCGSGFGETVRHAIEHGDETLHWRDLTATGSGAAARLEGRLDAVRETLRRELAHTRRDRDPAHAEASAEWRILDSPEVARRWLERAREAARRVAGGDTAVDRMARPGSLVFEGAQGILLDESYGFDPHTTWSRIGTAAVEDVIAEAGRPAEVRHLGVLRSYLTRHGAGPMPSEDAALDAVLAEPDNGNAGWQGRFRRGHADAVLMRYAVDAAGPLDGLVVSHLDAFARTDRLRWCEAWRAPGAGADATLCSLDPGDADRIVALRASAAAASLAASRRLGELLGRARPQYDPRPPRSAAEFIARVEATTGLPVRFGAVGPTHDDVIARPS